MLHHMKQNYNFLYLQDRNSLLMFGFILLLVILYESFNDIYITFLLDGWWACLRFEINKDDDNDV